ncbi:fibrobacter succinogenes major paralogous domain-containing protein [Mucilaginibacter terrae]|uniref:Uncharacterized protein (TIGR02145 family) n=1 Tax=Mucilaginibacter terrae TaxID=1955052 RepID=A0ABU3GTM9_9SPHI|nr:fibrobacter succinogenes major paralogous domain-containing protein [Mucilaginibacter terrae]MDT3403138.1 uncharacterized protein (TIGR02145 family) [Mucilaginibacter terrae]
MHTYIYVLIGLLVISSTACNSAQSGHDTADTLTNKVPAKIAVTVPVGKVIDYDGNTYRTVKIGTQTWMAENLRVAHYNSGDAIAHIKSDKQWRNYPSGAWCIYNNDTTAHCGYLYNWHAVTDNRKLAPRGWHIPTDAEWEILAKHLGGLPVAGSKLKANNFWGADDHTATGQSLFNAQPCGMRNNNGIFDNKAFLAVWWTTTTEPDADFAANYRLLAQSTAIKLDVDDRVCGFSVRCIKD